MPSTSGRPEAGLPNAPPSAERAEEPRDNNVRTIPDPPRRFSPGCVLVCVGPGPFNDRLITTGRHVATSLDAELLVFHVDAKSLARFSDADRRRLSEAFQLAADSNARVVTVRGRSVAAEIARYAREHNVIKIIVGRSPRPALLRMLRPSVADRLARRTGTVDMYVISTAAPPLDFVAERLKGVRGRQWTPYVLSVALMTAVTAVELPLRPIVSPANVIMPYFIATIVIALRWRQPAAVVGCVTGAVLFDYCFIPPYFTFGVTDLQYVMTLLGLPAVGLVTAALTGQVKHQADAAAQREAHTAALYSLSRSLAVTHSLDQIFEVLERYVRETFRRHVVILVPDGEGLVVKFRSADFAVTEKERGVASQVFVQGRPADVEAPQDSRYFPLTTSRGIVGVLGLQANEIARPLSSEHLRLLEAVVSQAASAIERELFGEKARQAQLLEETDRLQRALLNSISHNLRTPLASITGVLSTLSEDSARLSESARNELLETARGEAERLNRLVGNLLDMTRLEANAVHIHIEPCDVHDVIGAALAQLGEQARSRPIVVEAPENLPFVPMDFVLIVQALVNVLDNAVKYSPPEAPIIVRAEQHDQDIDITVTDQGNGIPAGDLDRVFDKFYRGRQISVPGSGLGLSISKGFVEVHGGRIRAERPPIGGTVVRLTLSTRPTQAGAQG